MIKYLTHVLYGGFNPSDLGTEISTRKFRDGKPFISAKHERLRPGALAIIDYLRLVGSRSAGEVAKAVGVHKNSAHITLGGLCSRGIVKRGLVGREYFYEAA